MYYKEFDKDIIRYVGIKKKKPIRLLKEKIQIVITKTRTHWKALHLLFS